MTRDEARNILLAGGGVEAGGLLYRFQDGRLEFHGEWGQSSYGSDIERFLQDSFPGPRPQEEIDAEIAELEGKITKLKAERGV